MSNSNALDPQSPQARAIYDLAIHSTVFVPWLFITTFLVILLVKLWMAGHEPDDCLNRALSRYEFSAMLAKGLRERDSGDFMKSPTTKAGENDGKHVSGGTQNG